jgi:hypothetical protein
MTQFLTWYGSGPTIVGEDRPEDWGIPDEGAGNTIVGGFEGIPELTLLKNSY